LHHEVTPAHLTGVTVSMRVMSAGDGYKYLLQSVGASDGHRPTTRRRALHLATGSGPGVHGLGTTDRRIEPDGTVTEG